MKRKIVLSESPADTRVLAKILLSGWLEVNKKKNSNWLICLSGELGSGKTAFAKSLAEELGVVGIVNSPTFVIMKKYSSKKNKKYTLYHFDCYRIREAKEVADLGFEEILYGENNIIIIEWPEKIREALPKKRLNLKFEVVGENTRRIELS
jgi:tRNA threonylcarbamoyladenosine biosynthesis protein TsaE